MTATLSATGVYTLTANTVYALPPKIVRIAVYTSGGTISTSVDGTHWQTITLDSNGEFITSAMFIRTTGAASTISLKAI